MEDFDEESDVVRHQPSGEDSPFAGEIDTGIHQGSPPPEGGNNRFRYALEAMKQQKATWQMDGLGLRGTATQVSNATANLHWDSEPAFRRPQLDQPNESPAPAETSAPADG